MSAFARNAFTSCFGLHVPVVGAAMSGHAGAELAAATARAGGLGFIGAARYSGAQLREEHERAQQLCKEGKGAVGVGLLNFAIRQNLLQAVIDLRPKAVWLACGNMQPYFQALHKADIPIIIQVNTLEEVEEACRLGATAIVAQGEEAGGHGRRFASTMTFVPEAVDLVRSLCQSLHQPDIPVLAAGGIADSRQAAAAMLMGAQAVVLGTRLVATHEAPVPLWSKQALIDAGSQARERPATMTTGVYDDLEAPELTKKFGGSWAADCIARALRSPFTDEWGHHRPLQDKDAERLRKQVSKAKETGNANIAPVWAGSGVGLINSIEPAEQLVTRFANQMLAVLQNGSTFCTISSES